MKAIEKVNCCEVRGTSLVINLTPEKETEKAVFISVMNKNCGSNKSYWLPKSVLSYVTEDNGFIYAIIADWFLAKNFYNIK